jgi:hypothetical protein
LAKQTRPPAELDGAFSPPIDGDLAMIRRRGVVYPVVGRITTTYTGTAVKAKTISHASNVRVKQ